MSVSSAWVAERYRLIAPLGAGGMGRVWLARDEMLRRDVAIKEVVPPHGLTEAEAEELRLRTIREARAAARLNDPHVVRIYDVIYTEQRPWIVMEYVPSRSLHQVITEDGPLTPDHAAQIGLAVLGALKAAHDAGVLHRDVKPGNVLLADTGRVVLTDFGLAIFEGGDGTVTRSGLILGSPQYIAPERAREGISGPEADLWSLGATLYAAVEGHSPYARSTTFATLTALATEDPDPPRRAGPLKPVLNALLRKDPRARANVAEAERLLRRAATGEGRVWPWSLPRQRRPRDGASGRPPASASAAKATPTPTSGKPNPPKATPTPTSGKPTPPKAPLAPASGPPAGVANATPMSGKPASASEAAPTPASVQPAGALTATPTPVSASAQPAPTKVPSTPVSGPPASAPTPTALASAAGASGSAAAAARAVKAARPEVASPVASPEPAPSAASAIPAARPAPAEPSAPADPDPATQPDLAAKPDPAAPTAPAEPEPEATTGPEPESESVEEPLSAAEPEPAAAVVEAEAVEAETVEDEPKGLDATLVESGTPAREAPTMTDAVEIGSVPTTKVTFPGKARGSASVPARTVPGAGAPPSTGSDRRWRWVAGVAAAVVLVVIVALIGNATRKDASTSTNNGRPATSSAAAAPAPSPSTQATASPSTQASPSPSGSTGPGGFALPPGFHWYTDPQYKWSIAVPDGWTQSRDPGYPSMLYFNEPTTPKRRLGVDRSSTPKPDPVADWTNLERSRINDLPGYHRERLEPVNYFRVAADWIYTYNGSSGRLEVCNRGFVVNDHLAHAIFWLTPAAQWDENQSNWNVIVASFQPGI